jgi:hypothetical protein
VYISGIAPPSTLGVFNNNLENGYRAFAERYLRCKVGDDYLPALKSSHYEWAENPLMQEFLEKLNDNLSLAPVLDIHSVVKLYNGAKRKVYERAEVKYWSDGVRKMDAVLKGFVKFEKCDIDKAPRCINPRSSVYNLCLARFLKQNEHKYFDALAKVFNQKKVVFKGMNNTDTAQCLQEIWDGMEDAIAIGGDAKKFDMHVNFFALVFEHLCYIRPYCTSFAEAYELYQRIVEDIRPNQDEMPPEYDDREQLCWLLSQQLFNYGVAYFVDGKLAYRMSGTRASGDINTSLGNCILMCAMTYCWKKTCNVNMNLVNNGDDCDYVMSRASEQKWRDGLNEFFERKGFRMELEPTAFELEEIEFCQSHPVHTIEGIKMVRVPRTLISKAAMCLLPINGIRDLEKWMMAIGVAEGSLGRGVPVIQSFARAMRRNGRKCSRRLINAAYYQSNRIYHADLIVDDLEITSESRLSFASAFGIAPDEQRYLERYYDQWQLDKQFGDNYTGDEQAQRGAIPVATTPQFLCQPVI